jgi:hypothetical protein
METLPYDLLSNLIDQLSLSSKISSLALSLAHPKRLYPKRSPTDKKLLLVSKTLADGVQIYWRKRLEHKYNLKFTSVPETRSMAYSSKKELPTVSYRSVYMYTQKFTCLNITQILEYSIDDQRFDCLETFLMAGVNYSCGIKHATFKMFPEAVELFLRQGANPCIDNNYCIKWASSDGSADIVRMLLEDGRANPAVENNYCLTWAARRGHLNVVKLLCADKRVAITNEAIKWAQNRNHQQILTLLQSQ